MKQYFSDFLELAPRSQKPRTRGFTKVGDQGHPLAWLSEMLDAYGAYLDGVKFTPSYILLVPGRLVEERIKIYRDHNVSVAIDDPTFAIAYYQGKAEQCLQAARDMGFTHAQVDTQHVGTGNEQEAEAGQRHYVEFARNLGFKLEGEVGKKWQEGDSARAGDGLLNVEAIIAQTNRLLALGCEHVYLESRVIREAIGDYGENQRGTDQIRQIMEAVGQDKMFIEISGQLPFDTRQCHRFWAVRNFGPEVNIGGGGSIEEVRHIESIRRGFAFVNGPGKSTTKLWVKSLARHHGKASAEWWKEAYELDPAAAKKR
jgi:phosphosulfolactate synthase (CoM biosynthesis protein A)